MTDDYFLDKYKPKLPSVFFSYIPNEEDFSNKEEYAFATYKSFLLARKHTEALFLVLGKLLKEIRDKRLYEALDYPSFHQFLVSDDVSFSRESAYLYIRAYEYFVEHLSLSEDAVKTIPISRIQTIIPVLKKIEEEEGKDAVIEKIKDLSILRTPDFVKEVDKMKKNTKPSVSWSEEHQKWIVWYYENTTLVFSKGDYEEKEEEGE